MPRSTVRIQWFAWSFIGAAIGIPLAYVATSLVVVAVSILLTFLWIIGALISVVVGGCVGGAVVGAVIGYVQLPVLTNHVKQASRWVRMGMLGWAIVGLVSVPWVYVPVENGDLSPLVWLALIGAVMTGFAQWTAVGRNIRHTSWWTLTSTAGVIAGSLAGIALLGAVTGRGPLDPLVGAVSLRGPIARVRAGGLTDVDGTLLLFVAIEDVYTNDRWQLWKSDGTRDGTTMVKSVPKFSGDPMPENITVAGETLFFSAWGADRDDEQHRNKYPSLWRTDGTLAGTRRIRASVGTFPHDLVSIKGRLFYSQGCAIWQIDGTESVVVRFEEPQGCPTRLVASGRIFYFLTHWDDPDGNQDWTLWKSDGTKAGTTMLAHLDPGIHRSDSPSSGTLEMITADGRLFVIKPAAAAGHDLWASDGTKAGTALLVHFDTGERGTHLRSPFGVVGRWLFLVVPYGDHHELWVSNGTRAGTMRVKTLFGRASPATDARPPDMNRTFFFTSRAEHEGCTLWRSDGTGAGTIPLGHICASDMVRLKDLNLTLFVAEKEGGGQGLWRSDGTVEGTTLVADSVFPVSSGGRSPFLGQIDGALLFTATDRKRCALWRTDGTEAGTTLIGRVCPREAGEVDGMFFFVAPRNERTVELWKSDGTKAGTVLVRTVP